MHYVCNAPQKTQEGPSHFKNSLNLILTAGLNLNESNYVFLLSRWGMAVGDKSLFSLGYEVNE